jgi:CheY-like chemotaxis protein
MASLCPDLVLLDVMMPRTSGTAVLRRMRVQPSLAAVPVAFVSALGSSAILDELTSERDFGILQKPFTPSGLRSAVLRYCGLLPPGEHAGDEAVRGYERLRAQRPAFEARVVRDLERMAALVEDHRRGDPQAVAQLRELAHALVGLASLFGAAEVARHCTAITRTAALHPEPHGAGPDDGRVWDEAAVALQTLLQAVKARGLP